MPAPFMLRTLGYTSWFFVFFLIGVYLTFPLEGAKGLIVARLEDALGKGKQGAYGVDPKVQLGELSLSGFGIEAERVQLRLASRDPDPGPTFDIDELSISVRPWTLLSSVKTVSVQAELYDGDVDAVVSVDDKGGVYDADVVIDDVDLARMPAAQQNLGVPVTGKLNLEAKLTLGANAEKEGAGDIELKLQQLGVGPGNLKLAAAFGGFEVPAIDVGTLSGKVVVKQGKGTLENVKLDGKDMQAELLGDIFFKQNLGMTRFDLDGWFMPAAAFLEREPKFKSLIQLAESFGGGSLSKAKDDQGHYWFSAKGVASSPSWMLSRDGGRRVKAKAGKATAPTKADEAREAREARRSKRGSAAPTSTPSAESPGEPRAPEAEAKPQVENAAEVTPPDGAAPELKSPEDKPAEEAPAEDKPAEE